MATEIENIFARYSRRAPAADKYSMLNPAACMMEQEKERMYLRWIAESGVAPPSCTLLEIGCGGGSNLLEFLRLGFRPQNLVGNELLPERARAARELLPAALEIIPGNAMDLRFEDESFDMVFQATVFSSILDWDFQTDLASRLWRWAKPGGGVLWYDFTYDNPVNRDVAGVSLSRVRQLFPNGPIKSWRLTLAPPIARMATKVHPALYGFLNALPFLRTHVLCWIRKPVRQD